MPDGGFYDTAKGATWLHAQLAGIKVQSNTEMLMLEMVRTLSSLESRIAALEAVIQFDGAAKPPLLGGERSYPNPCGVVLGQQKGVGPGLFISCQNERPCPDHPSDIDGQGAGDA